MARKPNRLAVLNTYSLDELLQLTVKKSRLDLEQQNQQLLNSNAMLSKMVGDEVYVPGRRKRGRPKGSGAKTATVKSSSGRRGRPPKSAGSTGKRIPLREHILKVLRKRAMSVDEIMEALFKNGFTSKASDPKRVVYIELKKMSDSGEISKPGRGRYAK